MRERDSFYRLINAATASKRLESVRCRKRRARGAAAPQVWGTSSSADVDKLFSVDGSVVVASTMSEVNAMAVMAHGSFSPEEELLSPESVATAATVLYICLVFSECKTTVQDDCKSSSS